MKKFALITLQDNNNIGNRLQNYALQTLTEKSGATVYNLDDGYSNLSKKSKLKLFIKRILCAFGVKKYKSSINQNLRRKAIKKFTDKYIHNIVKTDYNGIDLGFNLGITGSDQVWHKWRNNDKELSYYYLEFLSPEKRASYAPSFGFSEFPKKDIEEHKKGLNGMKYLSCREKNGCKLIKSLTGKNAVHVLDPTLLLDENDWKKLENNANNYSKNQNNYVFLYFLGNVTDEYKKEILKYSNNKTIINFMDFSNKNISLCGVNEFIYFIDHTDYIFTDSFHATVFSILFNKNFKAFKRSGEGFEDMYGRIEELLVCTKKEGNSYSKIKDNGDIEPFSELNEISKDYLKSILS